MDANIFTGKARIRARDIREQLKGKVEPALLQALETLAEQDGTLRAQIEMLADLVNKFTDFVMVMQQTMGAVVDQMPIKQRVDAQKAIKDLALDRIKLRGEDEAAES